MQTLIRKITRIFDNGTKILEFSQQQKCLKLHFKIKLETWKNMVGRY